VSGTPTPPKLPADELFQAGLADLAARRVQDARANFARCFEAGYFAPDALVFLGVCSFLESDETAGVELLFRSRATGKLSPDFLPRLGELTTVLGDPLGEDIWQFLKRYRAIPWQAVGSLIGSVRQESVEPWFYSRSAMNLFPRRQKEFGNLEAVVTESILTGFLPERPLFTPGSRLLTMGSCFAQELRNYLVTQGLTSDWLTVPPGLNNTFAIRQFVEWCLTGNQSSDAYWYDEADGGGAQKWIPEGSYLQYLDIFKRIDGLVLTVGLAEVWHDVSTGGVYWRGVPSSIYDPEKHKCRMSTVQENVDNLTRTIALLHEARPQLPIIVTLSPVPLRATFEAMSCFAADCISKSTLRVAIDEVMKKNLSHVRYWPSFEIVRWLGAHIDRAMFGEDGNTRHVNRFTVKLVLDQFMKHYFSGTTATRSN